MQEANNESLPFPVESSTSAATGDPLTDILRRGARDLLIQAVEAEAATWIADHSGLTDQQGHRQVVRNGYAASRTIVTGVGKLEVAMPRVHDRRPASGGVSASRPGFCRHTCVRPRVSTS